MKISLRLVIVTTILLLSIGQAFGQGPQSDELVIGPVVSTQNIQGVPVNIPVTAFLKLATGSDGVSVNLRLVGNLGELQQKIGSIIDTVPLPNNVCNHFGVDNIVARIWGKQLIASDDVLTLSLHGDVDDWTCVKNPIPCTRVDWVGGFIKYPQLTVYDCNSPIETIVLNQPFTASLSAKVQLVDSQSVAVTMLKPDISLGGKYGGISQGILNIAGVDINQKAGDALKQAIDPSKLRQALPPDIQNLNLSIADAGFSALNGQALISLHLTGNVPANQLTLLFQAMLAPKGPKP